jgi:hypothetical protein
VVFDDDCEVGNSGLLILISFCLPDTKRTVLRFFVWISVELSVENRIR